MALKKYFLSVDFDEKALKDCLDEFASRDRRFGGLTS